MGKILNAFLLDHIDVDIELLTRLNDALVDGHQGYGDDFTTKMSESARGRGAQPYRYVNCLTARPSEDIGRLASDHVRRGRYRGDAFIAKRLFTLLDTGVGDEADLASYLLFDGEFCRQLIEMGRADAAARRDELLDFFGPVGEDGNRGGDPDDPNWDRRSLTMPFGT